MLHTVFIIIFIQYKLYQCRQDPNDPDRPMQAQYVGVTFYYLGSVFSQRSKDYKNLILTTKQSVLTQGPRKQELPVAQTTEKRITTTQLQPCYNRTLLRGRTQGKHNLTLLCIHPFSVYPM